jgi:hypothetical protein
VAGAKRLNWTRDGCSVAAAVLLETIGLFSSVDSARLEPVAPDSSKSKSGITSICGRKWVYDGVKGVIGVPVAFGSSMTDAPRGDADGNEVATSSTACSMCTDAATWSELLLLPLPPTGSVDAGRV